MTDLNWPGTKLLVQGLESAEAEQRGKSYKLVQPNELHQLMQRVNTLTRNIAVRVKTKFPGTQPISFQHEHLDSVAVPGNYLVCEKSDGQRYLMLYAQSQCMLINTKMEFFLLQRDEKFAAVNDTLIDGELVLDSTANGGEEEVNFYIFDSLCFTGTPVLDATLVDRLRMVHSRDLFTKCPTPLIHSFRLKKMYLTSASAHVLQQKLSHESDGLIFTRVQHPYSVGRSDAILKWKPVEMNTVDFAIRQVEIGGERRFAELYWQTGGKCFVFPQQRYIYLDAEQQSKFTAQFAQLEQVVCECSFEPDWPILVVDDNATSWNEVTTERSSSSGGSWKFMRFRPDKSLPNSSHTVQSVIESIRNPVTKQQLLETVEQTRG